MSLLLWVRRMPLNQTCSQLVISALLFISCRGLRIHQMDSFWMTVSRNTCTCALAINECLVCPQVPYVIICIAMMPGSLHQLWHYAGLVLLVKVYFGCTLYYNTTLQLTAWACCGFSVCFESKTEEASKQIASMSSPAGMLSIWNSDVNRQLLPVLWRFSNTSCTIVWHDPDCNV